MFRVIYFLYYIHGEFMKVNSVTFQGIRVHSNSRFIPDEKSFNRFFNSKAVKYFKNNEALNLHVRFDSPRAYSFKITSKGEGVIGLIRNMRAPWIRKMPHSLLTQKKIKRYLEFFHPMKAIDYAIDMEEEKYKRLAILFGRIQLLRKKLINNKK